MKNDSENQLPSEADALRSDIDVTRRRMDDTIDDLGERLQPRHLVDEVLGYFRSSGNGDNGDSRLHQMRETVTRSAGNAMHSVVDTVKANPLPALVIGAGIAWMIYESRKKSSAEIRHYQDYGAEIEYDPDVHYDRPLDYPAGYATGEVGATGELELGADHPSKLGQLKENISEKTSAAAGAMKDKLSHAKQAAGERMHAMRERAAQVGGRVRERAGAAYTATRERVVTTAEQHPLETGLCCLAAGLVAGLLLPTPERVNRIAGPTASRLRERARQAGSEAMDKGRRVVRAAADAAKQEAKSQGLTPERLREKAGAVAHSAEQAAGDAARREGFAGGNQEQGYRREENAGQQNPNDPSSARPV